MLSFILSRPLDVLNLYSMLHSMIEIPMNDYDLFNFPLYQSFLLHGGHCL